MEALEQVPPYHPLNGSLDPLPHSQGLEEVLDQMPFFLDDAFFSRQLRRISLNTGNSEIVASFLTTEGGPGVVLACSWSSLVRVWRHNLVAVGPVSLSGGVCHWPLKSYPLCLWQRSSIPVEPSAGYWPTGMRPSESEDHAYQMLLASLLW